MKQMMKGQKAVIDLLKTHKSLTPLELQLLTGYAYNSITSRVSQLRKLGFDIQLQKLDTPKYVLVRKPSKELAEKILTWVKSHNMYGTALEYDMVAKEINIRTDQVVDGMAEIFKMGRLVQVSSTKAKVMM